MLLQQSVLKYLVCELNSFRSLLDFDLVGMEACVLIGWGFNVGYPFSPRMSFFMLAALLE